MDIQFFLFKQKDLELVKETDTLYVLKNKNHVVNAFENGGKEIRFERFYRVNLPAYVISMLTFVGLIAMYVSKGRRKRGEEILTESQDA
jgi:hypothetical protein